MGDQAVAKLSQLARNGKNERILDCYKKLQNSVLLQFTSYSLMLRYFNFNHRNFNFLHRMQEVRSSKPTVVTGICDPSKSRARHHRSLLIYVYYCCLTRLPVGNVYYCCLQ